MASLEGKSAGEIEALASLALSLSEGDTRADFLRLTKKKNPNAVIAEVDIPERMEAMFAERMKKVEELENKVAQQELQGRVEAMRREMGVTKDELDKIEKVMVENKIADHKTAKTYMDMQARQAEPTAATTAAGVRRFEVPKVDPKVSPHDMQAQSRQMAYQVIDELRGRRPPA